jgi:phage internal scaffolding protein
MSKVFRTAYGEKPQPKIETGEGLTEQSHIGECDVNNIIKRYTKTGVIAHVNKMEAKYGDFTALDFQQAQDLVVNAKNMFGDLPAEIRARFDNEPSKMLDFLDQAVLDESKMEEAVRLGLMEKSEPEPEPLGVPDPAPEPAPEPEPAPPE